MPVIDNTLAQLCDNAQQRIDTIAQEVRRVDASNQDVAQYARNAATVAASGVELAESTNSTFLELGTSSDEIGDVIRLIENIADSTQLLALNATIEAARAGEAGRGFSVVAAEVKLLAQQTAGATQQVADRVSAIQATAHKSIDAMAQIAAVIAQIDSLQEKITAEIREQDGMTEAIQSQISQAVSHIGAIAESIGRVPQRV